MSNTQRTTGAWQPIGLALPPQTATTPRDFVRDLSVARARRTARAVIAPGVILAATLGLAGTAAAHDGVLHTPDGDVPAATATPAQIELYGDSAEVTSDTAPEPVELTATGTAPEPLEMTTTSAPTSAASSPLTGLGGGELPGADLPVVGEFIANAPKIFSGGLLGGGEVTQTSVPRPSGHGEGEHTQGGDACDFFLEHMWKNEDGIPVLGTNTHFLTYHTDAEYENLILSLFSGSIGNSQMPIIDIYGGPLGWIPIFNPSHVEGHGTDYVTMLTGCGGMGLPIDLKTMELDLDKVPTPEKVLAFAEKIMPTVPDPAKILAPDYLYNTLAVDEITNRMSFETLLNSEEYLAYATNNFDAFRLLVETAFGPLSSGDPAAVLEVLQVTDNIKTLESLGLPGFSSILGGVVPQAGTTDTVTVGGVTYPVSNGKVEVDGLTYAVDGDTVTIDGKSYTVEAAPAGDSVVGELPVVGDLLGGSGSSPLDSLTGTLGGVSSPEAPGTDTPPTHGTDDTDDTDDGTPGTDEPAGSPASGLPIVGDLLGGSGSSPLDSLTGILGGSATTPDTDGTDGSTPGTSTPGTGTPGTSTPGSSTPGTGGTDAPADSPTAGLPVIGDLLGGSATGGIPVIGGILGGSSSAPSAPTEPAPAPAPAPGEDPTGEPAPAPAPGDDPTDEPAPADSPSSPVAGLPIVGDLLGGGLLGGSTGSPVVNEPAPAPAPGEDPSDDPAPAPGEDPTDEPNEPAPAPGTPAPGTPAPTTPNPSEGNSPIDTPDGTVAFNLGATKVNGTTSPNAPGVTVPTGDTVTFTLPVTNTGDLPITTLVGKASDGGTMTGAQLPLAPGQTTTLRYTTTAKPGTQALSFGIVGSNPNGEQQGKTCSAVYTGDVANGEIATTGALEVDDRATNDDVRYTFHTTDASQLEVQVTNNGDAPLQNITATSPAGAVTGGKTTLQPGESTWFSVTIQPKSGINTVPVNFTGTDATGKVTTAQERFEYTLCTCAATTSPQA